MAYSKNEFFNEIKEEFKEFGTKVNRIFDDIMSKEGDGVTFPLRVDAYETGEFFIMQADLPGFTKAQIKSGDVKLQVRDNTLTIKGERKRPTGLGEIEFHKKERHFGNFERSFTLPSGVELDGIKATFDDGVLIVKFPKSGEAPEPEKEINID